MENFIPSAMRRLYCNLDSADVSAFGGYSAGAKTTIADTSGSGGWVSGLSGLFEAAGTSFTNIYRTVNPPRPTNVPPGSMVLDPRSGQYVPAVQPQPLGLDTSSLLTIGLLVIGVVLVMRIK